MGSSSPAKKRPKTDPYTLSYNKSRGLVIKPENDTSRGRVLTGPEARKEQEKKTSRKPGGYKGSTRT